MMVDVGQILAEHERLIQSFRNSSLYPEFDLLVLEDVQRIDHVIEDELGVVGVLRDGSKIRLDGYIGTITMRIRYFMEEIASSKTMTPELVATFRELKAMLILEQEDVELAVKRMDLIEQVLVDRL